MKCDWCGKKNYFRRTVMFELVLQKKDWRRYLGIVEVYDFDSQECQANWIREHRPDLSGLSPSG